MNWQNKKVLITGAGGFLGSHLAEALVPRTAEVTCLVKYNARSSAGNLEYLPPPVFENLRILHGNIEDPEFVRQEIKGVDTVFHLAALIGIPYSYIANHSYITTNVVGTLNVLQACRSNGIDRLIHVSTSEVFGSGQYFPMDEKHPLIAQSPYAASKIGADKLVESFCRSYNLPTVIVRPFNTYGPRQSARAVIPSIIAQLFSSDTIQIGSTATIRDFTFVTDMIEGLIAAGNVDQAIGEEINLGTGTGYSIQQIVDRCMSITGFAKPVRSADDRLRPEKSEVQALVCNNAKARELLGWTPTIELTEGLSRTIDFVSTHRDLYPAGRFVI